MNDNNNDTAEQNDQQEKNTLSERRKEIPCREYQNIMIINVKKARKMTKRNALISICIQCYK